MGDKHAYSGATHVEIEMTAIPNQDWNFKYIESSDRGRAARLEAAAPPDALVKELDVALHKAIDHKDVRIAVDSKRNSFVERRAIVQFRISRVLYDWFFNARTGYRSRFWIDPRTGITFSEDIVATLKHTLERRLTPTIAARRIDVFDERGSRMEKDGGPVEIQREEIVKSLSPSASKIWICERLYSHDDGTITDIGFAVLSDAERNLPKLAVPRWVEAINPKTAQKGEGLRAPYPSSEEAWLDLKGGFLDANGNADQIKSQDERARHIYERGWT